MLRIRLLPPLGFALAALSCGPASQGLKSITVQDSGIPCPGGQIVWNLEISDQRARTSDSDHLRALLRESLAKSLPGCKWSNPTSRDAPTIVIEVHRFGADFDGAIWDAGAEWSVLVRDPSGRTLTEFQADARTSRPNYRGSDNEREALRAAFEEAVTRTVTGLRNVSSGG
jgi:hypothetical protein